MKKALAVLVAVLMLSAAAFAGPYFSLENSGVTIAPTFMVGADYSFALQTGPRISLDSNFILPTNDWDSSISAGFASIKAELETLLDFDETYALLNWATSFTITGYPLTGFKVWGGVSFNYDPIVRPTRLAWTLVPVFGIEGRW